MALTKKFGLISLVIHIYSISLLIISINTVYILIEQLNQRTDVFDASENWESAKEQLLKLIERLVNKI